MFIHFYSDHPSKTSGGKWHFVYKESKCSYTFSVIKHRSEENNVAVVFQLSSLTQIAACIVDTELKSV
jgi:hypothetical protein